MTLFIFKAIQPNLLMFLKSKRMFFGLFGLLMAGIGLLAFTTLPSVQKKKKMKVLIIDGQSNHGIWPKTTAMTKDYLEKTGLFKVEIARTKYLWLGPHSQMDSTQLMQNYLKYTLSDKKYEVLKESKEDPDYSPDFAAYDVVISNFGWKAAPLPVQTQKKLEAFVANGGGLITLHAANNAWDDWKAFNEMTGLGGWGNRNETCGPYVYYDKENKLVRDTTPGPGGSHGAQQESVVINRASEHPIMKGLPEKWMHTRDEIYDRLRGPAQNMTILGTTFSDPTGNTPPWNKRVTGTDRHEPMYLTVNYKKGRVFNISSGHSDVSFECVGFKTLLERGAEWAASGKVSQPVPGNFPTENAISKIDWKKP